ncbi:bifunctional lysylphosphatidylglycerol flippase/synthetase MprF [Varunaivibrio sulfuroxidans]|uniref:Phosphatidylglycerol lysyltransferase n=1 Tax=Varunaivibrio sulfuroxidans TaxID=1773489 RepID=A0A4V2UP29_9PROT|nr:bifunctional lysylphosphatidylglycerol flippase/synthetase MprF [Varunaivibrio sulfuroxidans]TCS64351.1 phosphatidylglycerol lysyltransferase [Varunaivibrio sulfuroxidans]WES31213.1 bifunctional lysylphosphatidylglycerol flippase/synthetase MprF [Varunaivibrio sulfuroxidans]
MRFSVFGVRFGESGVRFSRTGASKIWAIAPSIGVTVLFLLGLYALDRLLADVHFRDVMARLREVPKPVLGLAALSTAASYLALVGYDWSALRYLGKKLPLAIVGFTSFIGFALGNTLGIGALSGAAVRYRLYSRLGLDGGDIAIVSTFCAVGFGFGIAVVGSAAVIVHPHALAAILSLPPFVVRLFGILVLGGALGLLLYRSRTHGRFKVGKWSFQLPTTAILTGQLGFSILDIGFAGMTLYLLLPQSDLPLLTFMALFSFAAVAGVASHIPGGIGVFEGVLLTALQFYMPSDAVAAALFAYRILYYLGPFLLALGLLALSEISVHAAARYPKIQGLTTIIKPVAGVVQQSVPIAAAGVSFISGLLLLIGGSVPASKNTLETLETVFPLAFVELSHLTGSILGVVMIVLAPALLRRVGAALWVVISIVAAGAFLSLAQNLDFDRFGLMALVAVALLSCKGAFYRRARVFSQSLSLPWLLLSIAALFGLVWVLFFSFKTIPYSNQLWWEFAFNQQAPRGLRAAVAAVSAFLVLYVVFALRPPKVRSQSPDESALKKAKDIVRKQNNADANLALIGDKMLVFSPSEESFLMYGTHGRSWVAFGEPVGNPDDGPDLIWSFKKLADANNGRVAFYQVGEENLVWYIDAGFTLHKLGEEARVPLKDFSLQGAHRRDLRQSHNRALREELTFELLPPSPSEAMLGEIAAISDAWLESKNTREKGFSLGRFSIDYIRHFPLAIVREKGKLTAFANVFTTETVSMASVDLMRHLPNISPATMDFLFVELLLALKDQGYREFNLGMAPLAGLASHPQARMWDRFGAFVYRHAGHFYNFNGLRRFKQKFAPEWRPKYLATPGGIDPLVVAVDIAALISGGLVGALKR